MRKVLFILAELADSDLDWLIAHGAKRALPPGQVLIREGRPIEDIYIVLDGQLAVSVSAAGDAPIALLRSGEVIGELSFLDTSPPSATVTTDEETTLLAVPRSALAQKLEQDSDFASRFYRAIGIFLASRLRRSQQRLGFGKTANPESEALGDAQLDPDLLQQVALAGARFKWMLERLRQAPSAPPAAPGR